jgi:hypothetical protein
VLSLRSENNKRFCITKVLTYLNCGENSRSSFYFKCRNAVTDFSEINVYFTLINLNVIVTVITRAERKRFLLYQSLVDRDHIATKVSFSVNVASVSEL